MKRWIKSRLLPRLALAVLLLACVCLTAGAGAETGTPERPIGVAPSREEIVARYQALELSLGDEAVAFSEAPSLSAPYRAGQVSPGELGESLALLNFIRYVAGVPDDVSIKEEYASLAQHAAALMAANGLLSHTQTRRWDMPQDYFALGARGAMECNLGRGYGDIGASLLNYLQDTDHVNIFHMGHRRWLLDPAMQATGFGFADGYSATYAFDQAREGDLDFDHIAWPAANTPVELCTPRRGNYAFTVVLGQAYAPAELERITVSLSCGEKVWTLSAADCSLEAFQGQGRYLGVDTQGYGPANCVIFSVGSFTGGERVDIAIRGLVKDGKETELSYSVDFFSLAEAGKTETAADAAAAER